MKMAKVKRCEISKCAYNSSNQCHTMAITVGDEPNRPMCDTFCTAGMKGGDEKILAGVGACKVSECSFNTTLECQSPDIRVGHKGDAVVCMTYSPR